MFHLDCYKPPVTNLPAILTSDSVYRSQSKSTHMQDHGTWKFKPLQGLPIMLRVRSHSEPGSVPECLRFPWPPSWQGRGCSKRALWTVPLKYEEWPHPCTHMLSLGSTSPFPLLSGLPWSFIICTWRTALHAHLSVEAFLYHRMPDNHLGISWQHRFLFSRITRWLCNHFTLSAGLQGQNSIAEH